jgi:hypothetical protein
VEARGFNTAKTAEVDALAASLAAVEKSVSELKGLDSEAAVRESAASIESEVRSVEAKVDALLTDVKASGCDAATKGILAKRLYEVKVKIAGAGKLAGSIAEDASFIILHKAAKSFLTVQKTLNGEETVFKLIDKDSDGKITLADMKAFWAEHGPTLTDEQAGRAFEYLDSGEKGYLDEACVLPLTNSNYRCVKKTAISDLFAIDNSKILRTLEVGEILECLVEGQEDSATRVTRIKVKAQRDKKIGWATVKGNSGTTFLERQGGEDEVLKKLDQRLKVSQEKASKLKEALNEGERKVVAAETASNSAVQKMATAKAAATTPAAKKEAAQTARREALDVLKMSVKDARAWLTAQVSAGTASKEHFDQLKKRIGAAEEQMQDLMSSAKALTDEATKEEKAAA